MDGEIEADGDCDGEAEGLTDGEAEAASALSSTAIIPSSVSAEKVASTVVSFVDFHSVRMAKELSVVSCTFDNWVNPDPTVGDVPTVPVKKNPNVALSALANAAKVAVMEVLVAPLFTLVAD